MLRGKVPRLAEVASETEKASRSSVYLMFQSEIVSMLQFKDRESLIFAMWPGVHSTKQTNKKETVRKTIITT